MTGLEKILAEIENDAKEVARHNIEKAQNSADKILDEAKQEIEVKKADSQKILDAKYQDALARTNSSCELDTRKAVLKKKQELIAKVIEDSKQKLCNLSDDKYFDVLLKLVSKQASDETATIALGEKDLSRLPKDFEDKLPKNIKLSEEKISIKNGFVLIYEGIDINCSFDSLFNDKLEELQDKAASILFD